MPLALILWLIVVVAVVITGFTNDVIGNIYWIVVGSIGILIEMCKVPAAKKVYRSKFCKVIYGCEIPYWFAVLVFGVSLFGFHLIVWIYVIITLHAVWNGLKRSVSGI